VRLFVQKLNQKRDLINFPELAVRASEINAMGLIQEVFLHVLDQYKQQINPDAFKNLYEKLSEKVGLDDLNNTLRIFVEEFPPPAIYNNQIDSDGFLESETNGIPNKQVLIEDLVNLWLINENSAFSSHMELFNDDVLEKSAYIPIINEIKVFFESEPYFGPEDQNFLEMLGAVAQISPHSISDQLEFIHDKWGGLIGKYAFRILQALDLIKEEDKFRGLGPGKAQVYEYEDLPENYTPDRDWMPNVVMIAKNIYVWLDQLSKKYERQLNKLDQVPDEELELLTSWGFNALWLIGLWERSTASKTIKKWCGNQEAEASAYSLHDYVIAKDLGGHDAYINLKERAWSRGIRLASDMVPNHTGIDSKWMMEHPDWFISLPYSPFPAYSYSGQSLSNNPKIGIFLEDHYFSRTDAAVTFKRVDFETNDVHYIYHGNDGTSMPWNDTAQLNFLKPEARESVIQTILHVARMFPIIRFDAAMTLARKHYQRLWFPEPGSGGDIPSRAEHGLSKQDFYRIMPKEFWREVVDRINQEVPDTLLLAEAFWLLEGFFVRTLGMHRVYNSAFMNMLRDEDNAMYRSVIKNTLEYDPEILKRFVNFMNNPDEETAANQFGKGDKYFGICLLLATMPGLPMFGHGQVEGFAEKYGMEYRRAYWNEDVDWGFFNHHERIIFPLLRKRHVFSEVKDFLLFDFYTPEGFVNEDVFVYSNRSGMERELVIYHNKYAETSGWIKTSAAFTIKDDEDNKVIQKTIGNGLSLRDDDNYYCIFKDHITGLEYIRNSREFHDKGFYVELRGYQSVVLTDFREVQDNEWRHHAHLHDFLAGRGVTNISEALQELVYKPLIRSFKEIVNEVVFERIITNKKVDPDLISEIRGKLSVLLKVVNKYSSGSGDEKQVREEIINKLIAVYDLKSDESLIDSIDYEKKGELSEHLKKSLPETSFGWGVTLSWVFVHLLGKINTPKDYEFQSRSWIDEWPLGRIIEWTLKNLKSNETENAGESIVLIKLLTSHQNWQSFAKSKDQNPLAIMRIFLSDPEVQQYLRINRFQNVLWFNKEAFDELVRWLYIIALIDSLSKKEISGEIILIFEITQTWLKAAEKSGFQIENLLEQLR
jgi:glycosidase